jgi:glycerophosphoryl diester phosphodiesterase
MRSLLLALALANPWLGGGVMNMAHQGGEDEFHSNTMYAFHKAIRAGADMLELDVHATRDGKLIVMHDWQVDRGRTATAT